MEQIELHTLTDHQLLSLVKGGNQLAFSQIYDRYWERLYSSSINVLKDKGQAEDVIHEVFINIWTKRDKVEIHNLKNYLFRAVKNQTLLKIRNEKFLELHEEMIVNLCSPPIIEEKLAHKDLKFKIEIAAKYLPPRCKAIFFMSRYQEYSIKEIAEHYNISHRTVENQLHIALKHLRNKLGDIIYQLLFFSYLLANTF
ncbi:RNA polymerase sigma-70 factor [Maribacter sp. 2304DJ31-5]|uniref:RNA polymerase sigma-70 factor n=1 Tax=Maribacter sp. 2304DJ31-5 TaxID=3386273 RepID=UPI0039BD8AB1